MAIKTLHITNAYHPNSGGIGTFYRELFKSADLLGRPMRLIVPADRDEVEKIGEHGMIYHIRSPRSPLYDSRYRLILPHTYLLGRWGRLFRILREESPDLIEICDKYSLCWLAGMIRRGMISGLGRPVLVGMSCERLDDNVRAFVTGAETAGRLVKAFLGNLYIPLFDYHIANSPYTAEELTSAMTPHHIRPVAWRPMGSDISAFTSNRVNQDCRTELLRLCGGSSDTKLLLYAGRLSPEKNLSLLVDTMERLSMERSRDYRLLVAGDGPQTPKLRQAIGTRLDGKVALLGHISDRDRLSDIYANSDVFVHPNPHEPFGIAPLEAMAAGIPLVGPRSGGLMSYADDTNAWLTSPTAEGFAKAVVSVFADGSEREMRLARARITARNHSWELIAPLFFNLYDEMYNDFPKTRFAGKAGALKRKVANSAIAEERM